MSSMMPDQGVAQPHPLDQLAAIIGAGGGAGADPSVPPQQDSPDPNDLLQQILDIAAQYKQVEDDPQDLLTVEKVTTLVQQLIAANQKEADGMLQGKATPRAIRRASGGTGGTY